MANDGKICISICAKSAGELCEKIARAEPLADVIELRFDCLDLDEVAKVLDTLPKIEKKYLLTYRPKEQGGSRELTPEARISFWSNALTKLKDHDLFVDIEYDLALPSDFETGRTIVSMHNFQPGGEDSLARFDDLCVNSATTIKVAIATRSAVDAIPIWNLLKVRSGNRKQLIPIGMGEAGKWTRILGPAHGAFMTFASLETGSETAPGQITVDDMNATFRVKDLDTHTKVYGVLAGDTTYSISPWMQNAAFKAANMDRVFVPLQVSDVGAFIRRMVRSETREAELNFAGFAVTNPHKQAIIEHLDGLDATAAAIGAVNTVKIENGRLIGYNTDAAGFLSPLKKAFGDLAGVRIAVVGAGGAARAAIHALRSADAHVDVYVRDRGKTSSLAEHFSVTIEALDAGKRFESDIVVNTTPLGTKGENEDLSIASADQLAGVKLVYDLVYNPSETKLLRAAKAAKAATLGGIDMLIEQGAEQFRLWTGEEPSIAAMRAAIEKKLRL